jgi:hypothetical protein
MTDFEKQCYGMSTEAIREQYMSSFTARTVGLEMVVMGILSDCQELQEMAGSFPDAQADNTIRQYLNRAKFILSEMLEAKHPA